jgi:hypothetical protein
MKREEVGRFEEKGKDAFGHFVGGDVFFWLRIVRCQGVQLKMPEMRNGIHFRRRMEGRWALNF